MRVGVAEARTTGYGVHGMALEKLMLITHTDLDGVAAAAVYLRLAGRRLDEPGVALQFSEPYKLVKTVENVGRVDRVAIMDLGPNADNFMELASKLSRLVRRGVTVEWYDHHRWQEEWMLKLTEAGVKLFIDTSTCATGVVAKYASEVYGVEVDEATSELVRAVCAADLWKWDHPMAGRLFRVVDRFGGRRGDKWRRMMVEGFRSGSFWWPELEEALNEYLRKEFEGFHAALESAIVVEAGGCRFAVLLKKPGPPSASIIGNAAASRLNVDFVAIVRRNGSGVSLRSSRVNVREIALALGGGGHPRAAGAPLRMPFLLRLLAKIYPRLRQQYAAKRIAEALREIGCPRL